MSGVTADPKELFSVINRTLPNVATFVRLVLKREKLSEEAESLRAKYEESLNALEQGRLPPRPISFNGDDDSGYFSGNRPRVGSELSDPLRGLPTLLQTGYLLRRDEYRWHRSWCKADIKEMRFSIYEDSNEEVLVRAFSLENTSAQFNIQPTQEIDKDHCFVISGIVDGRSEKEGNGSNGNELYFAAYTEADYLQWKEALHLLTASRESGRLSFLDASQGGQDSTSTSSSNFSSNRESMVSTASSLLYSSRFSGRSESPTRGRSLDRDHSLVVDDSKALSLAKQQQPLPSPPHTLQQQPEEEGNVSDGTIYESIDNLVMQFNETMQASVQAMGQIGQHMKGGKKRKKKERSLIRQTSFFGKNKGQKSKLLTQKKAELEKGETYSGYLYKRNSSGSWKKKWCVLKGCIFSYYKSPEDTEGHEYVVLDAVINVIKDTKKHYALCLCCKGLSEMYFGVDDEDTFMDWLSRLNAASKFCVDRGVMEAVWQQDMEASGDVSLDSEMPQWVEGNAIYNVPRPTSDASVYDIPRMHPMASMPSGVPAVSPMTPQAAIDSGLYSVPRALLAEEAPHLLLATQGMQSFATGNTFDTYDVPRHTSISPDEEAIYDDPYDIMDMEIYDYPPDATELLWEDSGLDTTDSARNSTITMSSEFTVADRVSQAMSDDSWKTMSLPRIPASPRPSSVALSVASSDDYFQSARSSTVGTDGLYDYPRSIQVDSFLGSIAEKPFTIGGEISESALEYSQCTMQGYLYKRERFMQWTKLYCIVRNSFLECHKTASSSTSAPALKLFLPGSEIVKDTDVRRQWAFKLKHTRREGVLQFAAESMEDYKQWMKALHSASSIEVQPVRSVEDIRITDLEMKRRWTTMQKERSAPNISLPAGGSFQAEEYTYTSDQHGSLPRRNTIAHSPAEDYQSDTLKRRRKFSWMSKPAFIRKKNEKKPPSSSQPELDAHRISNVSIGLQAEQLPSFYPLDSRRKSVSLELLSTAESEEFLPFRSHHAMSEKGVEQFQGYLRVQRKGADSMWVRYWCVLVDLAFSCYISQQNLTLALSIQLRGSRISEAAHECRREYSFKVWHMESGQCLYFAADNNSEYLSWFGQVTKRAECFIPDDTAGPLSVPYYSFPKDAAVSGSHPSPGQLSSQSSTVSLTTALEDGDNVSVSSSATGHSSASLGSSIHHKGDLKKWSHSGKWKDRYCVIRDCTLYVYHSSADKTPLSSPSLQGCSVQQLNATPSETNNYTFQVLTASGKTHTFAAPSDHEMFAWITAIRDCSYGKPESQEKDTPTQNGVSSDPGSRNHSPALPRIQVKSSSKRRGKPRSSNTHFISNIPARTLSNPIHSGFAEVQIASGPCQKYWCVVQSDSLYIYETDTSESTAKTIVLPGCELQCTEPQVSQQFVITITHPSVPAVQLIVSEQTELNRWLHALEQGSRAERLKPTRHDSSQKLLPGEGTKVLSQKISSKSGLKKGPLKADHGIKTQVVQESDVHTGDAKSERSDNSLLAQRDAIIQRYEKRIRKTRKVATQTEQKLKRQQAAMLHVKRELSRHTTKLQELANKGDAHAQRKLKEVKLKLQQVDKIIPYLGKYIAVNRQAELQTVAILKESCAVDVQKLRGSVKSGKEAVAETQEVSYSSTNGTSTSIQDDTSESTITVTSHSVQNGKSDPDSQTASLQDKQQAIPEGNSQDVESTAKPVVTDKLISKNIHDVATPAGTYETESPYAPLSAVRPAALVSSNSGPSRDYARLDFSHVTTASAVRQPSVNYAQVNIDFLTGAPVIVDSNKSIKPQSGTSDVSSAVANKNQHLPVKNSEHTDSAHNSEAALHEHQDLEDTLTPENATSCAFSRTPPLSPIRSLPGETSAISTELHSASPVITAVKQLQSPKKAPPLVAKKPSVRQSTPTHQQRASASPSHSSQWASVHNMTEQNQEENCTSVSNASDETCQRSPSADSTSTKDALIVTEGTPSVMDRIKALQRKSSH